MSSRQTVALTGTTILQTPRSYTHTHTQTHTDPLKTDLRDREVDRRVGPRRAQESARAIS